MSIEKAQAAFDEANANMQEAMAHAILGTGSLDEAEASVRAVFAARFEFEKEHRKAQLGILERDAIKELHRTLEEARGTVQIFNNLRARIIASAN